LRRDGDDGQRLPGRYGEPPSERESQPTGSCPVLDKCWQACRADGWCKYDCVAFANTKAKLLYDKWITCEYGAGSGDLNPRYCNLTDDFFGVCKTACAGTVIACSDCLKTACKSFNEQCKLL